MIWGREGCPHLSGSLAKSFLDPPAEELPQSLQPKLLDTLTEFNAQGPSGF